MSIPDDVLRIRPLILKWSAWRARISQLEKDMLAALPPATDPPDFIAMTLALSLFDSATRAWIQSLTDHEREDPIALARAEVDMLWEHVSPSHYKRAEKGGWAFSDFRERFFQLAPLRRYADLLPEHLIHAITQLDDYAHSVGWLP